MHCRCERAPSELEGSETDHLPLQLAPAKILDTEAPGESLHWDSSIYGPFTERSDAAVCHNGAVCAAPSTKSSTETTSPAVEPSRNVAMADRAVMSIASLNHALVGHTDRTNDIGGVEAVHMRKAVSASSEQIQMIARVSHVPTRSAEMPRASWHPQAINLKSGLHSPPSPTSIPSIPRSKSVPAACNSADNLAGGTASPSSAHCASLPQSIKTVQVRLPLNHCGQTWSGRTSCEIVLRTSRIVVRL